MLRTLTRLRMSYSLARIIALTAVLGVLPPLLLSAGIGGGILLTILYPLLAGYVGWSVHKLAQPACWPHVLWISGLSAMVFLVVFLALYSSEIGTSYARLASTLGAVAVFVGAYLAAAFFVSLGVSARHARREANIPDGR